MTVKAPKPVAPSAEDAYCQAPPGPEELGWYMESLAQWLQVGRDPAGRRERLLREAALQDRTALVAEENAAWVARRRDAEARTLRQLRADSQESAEQAAQALADYDRTAGIQLGPHPREAFGAGGGRDYVRQEYQLYRAALLAAAAQ